MKSLKNATIQGVITSNQVGRGAEPNKTLVHYILLSSIEKIIVKSGIELPKPLFMGIGIVYCCVVGSGGWKEEQSGEESTYYYFALCSRLLWTAYIVPIAKEMLEILNVVQHSVV